MIYRENLPWTFSAIIYKTETLGDEEEISRRQIDLET